MGAWGKITLALVLALLPAPIQCLVSCAARMQQAAAPGRASCHHGQKGSGSQTTPCSQGAVVTVQRPAPLHPGIALPAGAFLLVAYEGCLRMVDCRSERSASASPPPGSSLFVLRI